MSRIALCLSLALLAAGCRDHSQTQNEHAQAQTLARKPIVALVPLIDNSVHDLPWNLSEELTGSLHHRLLKKDKLYLIDLEKVRSATQKLKESNNPFGTDLSWVKHAFPQGEFVVFMELIEHEEVPVYSTKTTTPLDSPASLNMSVRLRVLDLRADQPKVVLQELVHDSHHVPYQFTKANFYQVPWGKESFSISPLALAHEQLTKEIAQRIEAYILFAKSR